SALAELQRGGGLLEDDVVEGDLRRADQLTGDGALAMTGGERLALRPSLEGRARLPRTVRDVLAGVVATQELEVDEAGHLVEVGLPLAPAGLELLALALGDLEAVHGDEHGAPPRVRAASRCLRTIVDERRRREKRGAGLAARSSPASAVRR